jgi:hypothetical protein
VGYSLRPILVEFRRLRSLMGSKDVQLLQAVIQKYRRQMLDVDALGEFFQQFKADIKAEYQAFVAGDFSSVDLNPTYQDGDEIEEGDPEVDEALARFLEGLDKLDPDAPGAEKRFLVLLRKYFRSDGQDEVEEAEVVPVKELTTGAALAHLVLGVKADTSQGYKYGYALRCLCTYLGKIPKHDAWCSLRSSSGAVARIDAVLQRAGVEPETFSVSQFLIRRGSPVAIPRPRNFPFIGYLKRAEVPQVLTLLDPLKIEAAIRSEEPDAQEWVREAIGELRAWLKACVKADRDLICFYC